MPTVVVPWLRESPVLAKDLDPKRWQNTTEMLNILDDLAWAELWAPECEETVAEQEVLL